MFLRISFVFIIAIFTFSEFANADWVVLPESRHQLYQTYGLFIDQQSMLVYRDHGRGWGALGGTIAALGNDDWKWKPELVIHGSANAAYQINDRGDTLLTQTIDARVGLAIDLEFGDTFRGSVTWTHQSGHVADNVPDLDLFGTNLGNEVIDFRFLKDIDQRWRVGGGLRPTVGSDPGMIVFGAEEFGEYFPFGEGKDQHHFAPYITTGFEEYGRGKLQLTTNVQVGLAAGSHFKAEKRPSMRGVLGYYTGNDPRLKYYQFKGSRVSFAYGGVEFDI